MNAPTRIVVAAEGGVVTCVYCSDPTATVTVHDWDEVTQFAEATAEAEARIDELTKDLHEVY